MVVRVLGLHNRKGQYVWYVQDKATLKMVSAHKSKADALANVPAGAQVAYVADY